VDAANQKIGTDRLVLRPWDDADLPAVAEAATDPYIASVTSVPSPYSELGGRRFLSALAALESSGAALPRAIADRRTGRALGHVSLRLRDLDLGRASLGYWVVPGARGRGVAAEALAALAGWGFAHLPLFRAELYIEPWNAASKRVAERVGFAREGLLRSWQPMGGARADMEMYAMIRAS
jgi:RimJ/RimL family protein N-acetyltransferase